MTTMTTETYNGWANYETWNVALYIQNDYALYCLARNWVQDRQDSGYDNAPYDIFRHTLMFEAGDVRTADGVRWDDRRLDFDELTEMLQDL